jgi:hypothetical protein
VEFVIVGWLAELYFGFELSDFFGVGRVIPIDLLLQLFDSGGVGCFGVGLRVRNALIEGLKRVAEGCHDL